MMMTKQTAYARGVAAEQLALWWLRLRGYNVLAHRYKTPYGEIDIVAARGNVLAFIEVKQRNHVLNSAYAITPRAQQRIANSATLFLAQYALPLHDTRFDAVLIDGLQLWHLQNAWQLW